MPKRSGQDRKPRSAPTFPKALRKTPRFDPIDAYRLRIVRGLLRLSLFLGIVLLVPTAIFALRGHYYDFILDLRPRLRGHRPPFPKRIVARQSRVRRLHFHNLPPGSSYLVERFGNLAAGESWLCAATVLSTIFFGMEGAVVSCLAQALVAARRRSRPARGRPRLERGSLPFHHVLGRRRRPLRRHGLRSVLPHRRAAPFRRRPRRPRVRARAQAGRAQARGRRPPRRGAPGGIPGEPRSAHATAEPRDLRARAGEGRRGRRQARQDPRSDGGRHRQVQARRGDPRPRSGRRHPHRDRGPPDPLLPDRRRRRPLGRRRLHSAPFRRQGSGGREGDHRQVPPGLRPVLFHRRHGDRALGLLRPRALSRTTDGGPRP